MKQAYLETKRKTVNSEPFAGESEKTEVLLVLLALSETVNI